jgi:hypothetical protein
MTGMTLAEAFTIPEVVTAHDFVLQRGTSVECGEIQRAAFPASDDDRLPLSARWAMHNDRDERCGRTA